MESNGVEQFRWGTSWVHCMFFVDIYTSWFNTGCRTYRCWLNTPGCYQWRSGRMVHFWQTHSANLSQTSWGAFCQGHKKSPHYLPWLKGHHTSDPAGQSFTTGTLKSSGIQKMKEVIRSHVWWAGMSSDIESFVKHCMACTTHQKKAPQLRWLQLKHAGHPLKKCLLI